jgi:phenylalanyl-tRNA synthetase beta chain
MLFSYNWLQSYFLKKLPKPKELAELLTMHSFEIEELKKVGNDWAFDIDILANRVADCCGHIGIAREIGAILNISPRFAQSPLFPNSPQSSQIKIEVKDKNACPRYTAAMVENIKVGESPKYTQERLKICGLRPINNIVDAVNYVMLETGQPLHVFDFAKIKNMENTKHKLGIKKIIVRKAKVGERITSLDNVEYELDKDVLVIADSDDVLAIAGIKGGKKAEIDKNTKTIILEAANFEPSAIRKARQKLNLQTDASFRFEHNLDPNLTEPSINRVLDLIGCRCPTSTIIDVYSKKVLPKRIKLDLDYMERLLGIRIPLKEIINILNSLGFQQFENGAGTIRVLVPTFRQDVSIQEDLIEEITRIYGYDKILSILPNATLIPPEKNYENFWKNAIKNVLKETGFSEVYNYSFVSPKQASALSLSQSELIEVQNPVSKEQKYMRPSLIPNLLKNVEENLKNFDSVKIFEIGKVYTQNAKSGINERTMLSGAVTTKDSDEGFYELKGIVDLLLNKLGISNIRHDNCEQKLKCAEIKIDSQKIGFLGEVDPSAGSGQGKVIAFDLDFEKLITLCSEEHEYQVISQYPSAVRDLAILVPQTTKVVDVMNKINITGGKIIRDVDIFDIYAGSELPDGKKNFAFHIIYQAQDRTLSTKEIDTVHKKIMSALEKNIEWQVRK